MPFNINVKSASLLIGFIISLASLIILRSRFSFILKVFLLTLQGIGVIIAFSVLDKKKELWGYLARVYSLFLYPFLAFWIFAFDYLFTLQSLTPTSTVILVAISIFMPFALTIYLQLIYFIKE